MSHNQHFLEKIMKKSNFSGPSGDIRSGAPRNSDKSSNTLDYKNVAYLRRFITEQGKILSRRITGLSAYEQRQLTKAVKQARILGLLGFTPSGSAS